MVQNGITLVEPPQLQLSDREKQVLQAALAYALANADDLNDTYASYDAMGDDEDTEAELISVGGQVAEPLAENEFENLAQKFGIALRD